MSDPPQSSGTYYSATLSGERLRRCYAIASPRIQQYLSAEIDYTLATLRSTRTVLELGCGYGRVLGALAPAVTRAFGVDTSLKSLQLAQQRLAGYSNVHLISSNAVCLGIQSGCIDTVVCVQNGISAFGVDPERLVQESLRIVRPGGSLLFSTYSERFWPDRLEWFERQADEGLIGTIDWEQTREGTIVCHDGFRATMYSRDRLEALAHSLNVPYEIEEVDFSSVFLAMTRPER